MDLGMAAFNSFMQARLKGQGDEAAIYLDANGKQAYSSGGLSLVISGGPHFTRLYVLPHQNTSTQPHTPRLVVRLLVTQRQLDRAPFEEAATLRRHSPTRH